MLSALQDLTNKCSADQSFTETENVQALVLAQQGTVYYFQCFLLVGTANDQRDLVPFHTIGNEVHPNIVTS